MLIVLTRIVSRSIWNKSWKRFKTFKKRTTVIKIELNKTNQRIGHAEDRIEGIEIRVQNVEETMTKMIRMQSQLESKQIDQEGRSRRDNIRIYNVPEDIEKNSMNDYVEQLLRDTLDFPPDTELHVERDHRAPVPKPRKNARPRSIVVKFLRYKMKEEVIRKAWVKQDIFVGQQKIYFDHDYPPAVLQKRKEYSEVKKALKDRKIRFQTPYPARLRVFYEDGTHIYHTAEDAYLDMVKRGFHVEKTPLTESLMEQLEHTSWAQQKTS
ncbi:putative transposase element L1Md-A101/L1Md-A102/L1Md-A2 [Labeo rohita]|uniref:Putative transposase element L1Md-A101/L1Md-A102/L1Md-A2 n=1 Tax=Labeo rohita TaxID=84645 RepID=A0A498NVA5_LABRO|nr:putative transposase element L1Md-A101/L1Md-A102/L1Md-A2 [Labeo rohita]